MSEYTDEQVKAFLQWYIDKWASVADQDYPEWGFDKYYDYVSGQLWDEEYLPVRAAWRGLSASQRHRLLSARLGEYS